MGKTVLLAWETGAGLGHARRLLFIASALAELGYRPIVAARELRSASADYRVARIPVIQAPAHRGFKGDAKTWQAQSYADLMAACAWDDIAALEPVVAAWDALIDVIDPALVIADFCPILPLATLGRVPLLVIGDGFVVPPPERDRMPALRRSNTPAADEAVLLENGNAVLAPRGRPGISALPALVGGDRQVVITYPETDTYGAMRQSPAAGPLNHARHLPPPTMPGSLFLYLTADHAGTGKCLQAVVNSGLPARAFIRDANEKLKGVLRRKGLFVHDTPPDLVEELRQASSILHHGGIGTAETALAAGRVQILLPRHLEQSLNARRLMATGAAGMIRQSFEIADALAAIQGLTAQPKFDRRAAAVAEMIGKRPGGTGLDHVMKAVAELV